MSNPTVPEHSFATWRALRWFVLFHLALVLLVAGLFLYDRELSLLGSTHPRLFGIVLLLYMSAIFVSGVLLLRQRPAPVDQVAFALFVDVIALTLLMHSSGGINSGLGLLLAISITLGSLLVSGRLPFLFASFGTLALLSETAHSYLTGQVATSFTQTALLGATFFTVALLSYFLSHRLRETAKVAARRSVDLESLTKLNEYVIQAMHTGVAVVDADSRIRLLNGAARELLDRPDAKTGDSLPELAPELAAQVRDLYAGRPSAPLPFNPGKNREIKPGFKLLGEHADAGVLIFLEDNTKLLQEAQQMKLASLGRLTASIAHEIRNPLGAISHAGQLLAESPQLDRAEQRLLEIIQKNASRLNETVETVLQLSRRNPARAETLDLRIWLERFAGDFLHAKQAPPEILSIRVEPPDTRVCADSRHLRQVLDNLCDNALRHGAGSDEPIHIQLRGGINRETGIPFIEVADNGPGIDLEVARSIFEPFFTTSSKGTGLGLYIARELCEANRVLLQYRPLPKGSCFRLGFPYRQGQGAQA
jgi:two-component system sensor histidine kinase PilS (NtrC family)